MKSDKPKISDQKRTEPEDKTHRSHHKKKYPPHWQVRPHGVCASKGLLFQDWHFTPITYRAMHCYTWSDEYKLTINLVENKKLDEALAIYAQHHPETTNWPVRFINIQPMETTREILV